jgi:hypothetical protein
MGTRAMRGWGASAALATQQIRPPDPYTTSADADAKETLTWRGAWVSPALPTWTGPRPGRVTSMARYCHFLSGS